MRGEAKRTKGFVALQLHGCGGSEHRGGRCARCARVRPCTSAGRVHELGSWKVEAGSGHGNIGPQFSHTNQHDVVLIAPFAAHASV
eukprot:5940181-Prorocentrum_lima.AAC.1